MIITALAAISKNGLLTDGSDPHPEHWTSEEDKAFFKESLNQHQLLFMGSTTYEAGKKNTTGTIPHRPTGRLRVVFTRDPSHYQAVPGKLEFTSLPPAEAVKYYEAKGFTKAALLGGAHLFTSFLEAGLITDMCITIEPVEFATGTPLFIGHTLETLNNYKIESEKRLNNSNTLLRRYIHA